MNSWTLFFGGLVTGAVALWAQIKSALSQVASISVIRVNLSGDIANAVLMQCWEKCRRSPLGMRSYFANRNYVKPSKRWLSVLFESIGKDSAIFFHGKVPLIISGGSPPSDPSSPPSSGQNVRLTFIRGTINVDKFLSDALANYNGTRHENGSGRFYVHHFSGSGKSTSRYQGSVPTATASPVGKPEDGRQREARIVGWSWDQIGMEKPEKSPFESLAFNEEVLGIVTEAKRWKSCEQWYREKQIPWRRGWLLHGLPGTGKTSLARAIAQELDLPICIFDLASMCNEELRRSWGEMMERTPCIALIEDIDAVFLKRQNRLGQEGGGLSFDCLLNCISGIEDASGVLLIVTTNRIEDLDEALGTPSRGGSESTRPGRIDRAVFLGPMNSECRRKLAERILSDCPSQIGQAIADGDGETAAQFQERCSQIALKHLWSDTTPVLK